MLLKMSMVNICLGFDIIHVVTLTFEPFLVVTYVQTTRFVTSMAACSTISTACIQLFQNIADQPRFMFPFQGRSNIITIHRFQMLPVLSVCLISLFFITEFGCRRTKRSTHQEVMLFPTTTAKVSDDSCLSLIWLFPPIIKYMGIWACILIYLQILCFGKLIEISGCA